jgi:hypothetical protein
MHCPNRPLFEDIPNHEQRMASFAKESVPGPFHQGPRVLSFSSSGWQRPLRIIPGACYRRVPRGGSRSKTSFLGAALLVPPS